ncbi:MAG: FmdB family zinc ribbon protein [Thermoanaerobaculia bacterium]
MPLFEFACNACGTRFEEIVSSDSVPTCPACASEDLKKLQSTFAMRGGRGPSRPAPTFGGG